MTVKWEKVHVFISSTFNDMHAERDYLIKQVFPQLREWCEQRKLRLVDIDLRWGVTEQDALYNRNVVKVCLDRIDDCRPFFLCFLGQRRGWVPAQSDISDATLEAFPDLRSFVGNTSVTEMEILHALVNPLHRSKPRDPGRPDEFYDPVKYAFFYLRDDTYIGQLPEDPPQLRQTYTNESIQDKTERAFHDNEQERWRNTEIPRSGRPCHHYQARWDTHLNTPELLLPLQCPSTETVPLERWRVQWEKAGVKVEGTDIELNPALAEKAREYNRQLMTGRLMDFQVEEKALSQLIVRELQEAIATRFPDHTEIGEESDLQKELDQHEQFLFTSSEGFIRREGDFDALDAYVDGDSNQLFALTAPGGIGKSTLLANWIEHDRSRNSGKSGQSIHFRFIGQSDRSTTVYSLLQFLLREMKEVSKKFTDAIPDDPQKLRQELPRLLEAAGKKGRTVIVLDALNQLESGLADLAWLPYQLPKNVKLIVSFKRGDPAAEALYQNMQGQVLLSDAKPFANLDDRRKLVRAYLSQYLKDLDERHLETLIQSPGADNPLFLKVVLSELRVFGAFANLGEKISSDFGRTPITAFQGVLKRLENDPAYSPIDPKQAVPLLFGLLAHTRQGLTAGELTGLIIQALGMEEDEASRQAASECVHLYLRQVRPFLAYRDSSYDFFFESFRLAAQERYVGGMFPQRTSKEWHRLLAEYFIGQPLNFKNENDDNPYQRKLSETAYHQAQAGLANPLANTLLDFNFMQTSIAVFGPYKIIKDYDLLDLPSVQMSSELKENLLLVRDALQLSAHILVRDAAQCSGQLIGRLHSIDTPIIKTLLTDARAWWGDRPWLYPTYVHFSSPGGALSKTLIGEIGGTELYALPDGKQVLTVSRVSQTGQTVRIWDLEKKSLASKYERVFGVAVTPDGRRAIFSYSQANQIELKVLDPLTMKDAQSITAPGGTILAQAVSPDGRLAVTVSHWGSLIKTWDLQQGRERSSFHTRLADEVIPFSNGKVALLMSDSYSPPISGTYSHRPSPTTISVWDTEKQMCLFEIGKAPINSFMVTLDGKIGVRSSLSEITTWNMEDGTLLGVFRCAGPINSIQVSADGTNIISCGKGLIQVWDLKTGKEVHQIQSAIPGGNTVTALNGNTFAAAFPGGIEIWDIATGKMLASFASPDQVRMLHFLPNGKGLIVETTQQTGGGVTAPAIKNTLKALELESGKDIYALKTAVYGAPIVMTPDRRRAAAVILVGKDGKEVISTSEPYSQFIVWDLEEGKVISGLSGKQTEAVNTLSISPDGLRVLSSSSRSNEIKCWNVESGSESASLPLGDLSGVDQVAWLPGMQQAVSGSSNFLLTVWDLEQGRVLYSNFTHRIENRMMINLLMSADGKKAVTVSNNDKVKVWDLRAGSQRDLPIPASPLPSVRRSMLTPDGQKLISMTNSDLKVWNLEDGAQLFSVSPPSKAFSAYAIDPINMKAVSPDKDKLIVTDFGTGRAESVQVLGDLIFFPKNSHPMLQKEPVPMPDGRTLLAITGRQIIVWDLKTGAQKNTLTAGGEVSALALSPDGHTLFSSSHDTLQVWDMDRLEVEGSTPGDLRRARIVRLLFTPDGKKVVSGSNYQSVKVWDFSTGKQLFSFPVSGNLSILRVLPDGKRLLFSTAGAMKIIELETGQECLTLATSWGTLTVSPDGKFALMVFGNNLILAELEAGAKQRILKKYDPGFTTGYHIDLMEITPDNRRAVISYVNHDTHEYSCSLWDLREGVEHPLEEGAWVRSIQITRDGKRAVTAYQHQFKVWDLEKGRQMHCIDTSADVNTLGNQDLITPDEKTILSVGMHEKKHVRKVWDLESGAELHSFDSSWANLGYLPNGRQCLSGSYDVSLRAVTLKLIDLQQYQVQVVLEGAYDQQVQKIMVTPDSRFAVSVGLFVENKNSVHNRLVEVWNLRTGKRIAGLFMDTDLSAIALAPDGRTIIVGDMVGQVHFLRLEGVIS